MEERQKQRLVLSRKSILGARLIECAALGEAIGTDKATVARAVTWPEARPGTKIAIIHEAIDRIAEIPVDAWLALPDRKEYLEALVRPLHFDGGTEECSTQ